MSQKSYDNTPTLYLIPTPIGNMGDITLRAIETLRNVEVVFSEDTRVTGLLLQHFQIKKHLISSHKFNEKENAAKLLSYLDKGKDVGLVSDRGTPIISDPGYDLALIAIEKGYNVVSLPGATALIPAITMSGLSSMPFTFYGFLNNKSIKRKKELEELKDKKETIILYESPHRIEKTLKEISDVLGNRNISISREISKKYEEIIRGKINDIIKEEINLKGEIVLVIEGNKNDKSYDNLTLTEHVNLYIKEGFSINDSIKKVSQERKIPKKEVYSEYHNIKK